MGLLERLRAESEEWKVGPVVLEAAEVIEALTASLSDFMENAAFQVAIGGNPHAVDAMMSRARHALALSREAQA